MSASCTVPGQTKYCQTKRLYQIYIILLHFLANKPRRELSGIREKRKKLLHPGYYPWVTLFSYKDTYPPTLSALQHSIFTKQPFIPSHGFLALRIRFNPMKWFYCCLFFTAASWSHSSAFSWTDRHCAAYTNRAFSSLVKHSRFT